MKRIRLAASGRIYGAMLLALMLPVTGADAGSFQVLYAFRNSPDGAWPRSSLLEDVSGNFFGTTELGGTDSCYGVALGCGTVYELAADGSESVIHTFNDTGDGNSPWAGLIMDYSGNLYGATATGGTYIGGTVFKLAPDGTETILYEFGTNSGDAHGPVANLLMDSGGNLYGTASYGNGSDNNGTIFKVAPDGSETILYTFNGLSKGANPFDFGGLIMDRRGNFYGTAYQGGRCDQDSNGCGTIWLLKPNGKLAVLHTFAGGSDGAEPESGVARDKAGNLYGTTELGGDTAGCNVREGVGCGTVYRLAPDGTETILHAFTGGNDGAFPLAPLLLDDKGNLYGTTTCDGGDDLGCSDVDDCNSGECGTVFRITPDGTETVIHVFKGGKDGAYPAGRLLKGANGLLYGTTTRNGAEQSGTIFSIKE